jgi:hypothetical protein
MAKTSKAKGFDGLEGVNEIDARAGVGRYVGAAKRQCVWDREVRLSESAL